MNELKWIEGFEVKWENWWDEPYEKVTMSQVRGTLWEWMNEWWDEFDWNWSDSMRIEWNEVEWVKWSEMSDLMELRENNPMRMSLWVEWDEPYENG